MMKRFFPALFAIAMVAPLYAQAPLRVAAAADLAPVLPPILQEFQQATGIHAEATFQASAMLTSQIENGAPFDVFMSADLSYPKRLLDAGLADTGGLADSFYADHLRQGHACPLGTKGLAVTSAFARSAAQPKFETAGHCQSRPRALRPRRRGCAHQP